MLCLPRLTDEGWRDSRLTDTSIVARTRFTCQTKHILNHIPTHLTASSTPTAIATPASNTRARPHSSDATQLEKIAEGKIRQTTSQKAVASAPQGPDGKPEKLNAGCKVTMVVCYPVGKEAGTHANDQRINVIARDYESASSYTRVYDMAEGSSSTL